MTNLYPLMPQGTCYESARHLAATYPELGARKGYVVFTHHGERQILAHAWNVLPDGTVVDSTFRPRPWTADLEYLPTGVLI